VVTRACWLASVTALLWLGCSAGCRFASGNCSGNAYRLGLLRIGGSVCQLGRAVVQDHLVPTRVAAIR
jgi:hypothetical protein